MEPAAEGTTPLTVDELRDAWPALSASERAEGFLALTADEMDDFFLSLSPLSQAQVLTELPTGQRRVWMRILDPDDAADVVQEVEPAARDELLALLDEPTRREVNALLAYAEDAAGGLMSPRFARIRADMRVGEAIRYLQRQARDRLETIYYAYILDPDQHLLGVCSFRELFAAAPETPVKDIMHTEPVAVLAEMDQERVASLFLRHGFLALPVLDADSRMKGIVTIDDIVDVVQEEATEDFQKLGGMQALDTPYLQTRFLEMFKKRGGWLVVLFLGGMLTIRAMERYQAAIEAVVALAAFVPLIISSGGNSGSQAATLIIRAMALGEVRMRDWLRIIKRELVVGVALGTFLGLLGASWVAFWQLIAELQGRAAPYGEHGLLVAATIWVSVIGVVTWGTTVGCMLPFVIRRFGFDPASASAPFVATLVDVTGIVIYFTTASVLLSGVLF